MRKDGSRTRRRLIETSLQLFSVKGYYNTSINDILEATGLTKGGLYGHFASKEALWAAAYERAVEIWKEIVFEGVRGVSDPLERIAKVVENDLRGYVGGDVFTGGCFFFNMLVELSGQAPRMSGRILRGFVDFSRLLASWLEEAHRLGMLKPGIDHREAAEFITISLNGATALYAASRDPRILASTVRQLRAYLSQLRAARPAPRGRGVQAGFAGPAQSGGEA